MSVILVRVQGKPLLPICTHVFLKDAYYTVSSYAYYIMHSVVVGDIWVGELSRVRVIVILAYVSQCAESSTNVAMHLRMPQAN